jgi:SAM-dependent methyltransferase
MSHTQDGLNLKLLDAIPAMAQRVLELGCGDGRLGRRFKELHRATHWCGVDFTSEAVQQSSAHLDHVVQMDLDHIDLSRLPGPFDVIVIGDLLEHLRQPLRLLEGLHDLATADAQIVCCLPNMAHLSVIERLVAGDISYDPVGLLDDTHVRFFSPSSAFKTFLDGGWLPHLQDQYRAEVPPTAFAAHIVEAAKALGLPAQTAVRNLGLYQMILVCRKWSMASLQRPGPNAPFSIIVPVNKPWQHELNVARSPGLREVDAEVICVQGATSAAAAYAHASPRARHAWQLLVHQDVYFPTGSGFAIARELGRLEQAGHTRAPVGFAGLAATGPGDGVRHAGLVIDRTALFNHPGTREGVSVDELAVALHRDHRLQPDPSLGWHLWGTDLCLQAEAQLGSPSAVILDVPVFHNSTTAHVLPEAFHQSASLLMAKYPKLDRIPTLCGEIGRQAAAVC